MKRMGLFVSMFLMGSAQAVTLDELAGSWSANYKTRLNVQSLGTSTDGSTLACQWSASSSTAGTFTCTDAASSKKYSGTLTLAGKGKKVLISFDSASTANLESEIEQWMLDMADSAGLDVDADSVSLDIKQIDYTPLPVSSDGPGKTSIMVKGKVSAVVDGKNVNKTFAYKNAVSYR